VAVSVNVTFIWSIREQLSANDNEATDGIWSQPLTLKVVMIKQALYYLKTVIICTYEESPPQSTKVNFLVKM
jgi:hypothetical protein